MTFSLERFPSDSFCRARMPFVTSTRCTPTATLAPPLPRPSPPVPPALAAASAEVKADAKSGKVAIALLTMSHTSVPLPGPISTSCISDGLLIARYCVMSHTRSDSPNSCDTSGAVMKSPPAPMTCSPPASPAGAGSAGSAKIGS